MCKYYWLILLLLLGIGCCAHADDTGLVKERVHTADGTFDVYYRTPAQSVDLGLPLPPDAAVATSFVYRVRDRKERDRLFLARVEFSSAQSVSAMQKFYLKALGKSARQASDAKSGEITITTGVKDHARLVIITPQTTGCKLRLEQVQHFTIPARIYTHEEQKADTLMNTVAANYHSARAVSYTLSEVTTMPPGTSVRQIPPPVTWTVSLTRPTNLHVTAEVAGKVALEISSDKDALLLHRQQGKDETRPLQKTITIADVPELGEDPVARMILGNKLIDEQVEQISMTAGVGSHAGEQTLVLGMPEQQAIVTLVINEMTKTVLSCVTVVTDEENTTTVTRTYSGQSLTRPTHQ